MLLLLSPSKTQDFTGIPPFEGTQPRFLPEAAWLMKILKALPESEWASLMNLSPRLAASTREHCNAWTPEHSKSAKPAALAFSGEAFASLDAASLSVEDRNFAQVHLRILSGLYGLLRPLDLIQAHRLEMAVRLRLTKGKPAQGLQSFWNPKLTSALQEEGGNAPIVNLASLEYSKAVKLPMLNLHFQEPNGRVQSFASKRARGLMARFAIQHRIQDPRELQTFTEEGYAFQAEDSSDTDWVFRR